MLSNGKKLKVHSEGNTVVVEFNDYTADVVINDSQKITTAYNPELDLDEAAKKLTKAILKESRKKNTFYDAIFPSFGREFKILVSNILKARI